MADTSATQRTDTEVAVPLPAGWLSRWPWVTFVLPILVYMLVGTLEPTPPDAAPDSTQEVLPDDSGGQEKQQPYFPPEQTGLLPEIPYEYYPWIYTLKIA